MFIHETSICIASGNQSIINLLIFNAFNHRRVISIRFSLATSHLVQKKSVFKMFAKLVFAESFCFPGGDPYLAAPSPIHRVAPFLDAKLNALVVTEGYSS